MKFILNKDKLTIENKEKTNSGSINYYEAEVEYDESWENLIIKAVFIEQKSDLGRSISLVNNRIYIDNDMEGTYEIGFVGYTLDNDEKTYQISTNLKSIYFNKGAGQIETEESVIPTPTEWEIYIAQIQAMLEGITMIPSGGTIGQALVKKSNTDYDYEWKTVQGGGSSGTTNHAELDNLDYEHSGHTGFQRAGNYVEDNNYVHTDNNFSNELKNKLNNLENYDDTEIKQDILDLDTNKANKNEIPDISGLQDKITSSNKLNSDLIDDTNQSNKFVTTNEKQTWNNKSNFSGSYNDLTDKPTIPSEVTEATVANWGFTKNTGTYSKPSGGIPKTDLASDVQTSLGKADTSIQQSDLTNYQLKPTTQTITETSATITPVDNTIYECGELTSLTITNPPATGMYVIIFTSGTTATTTTIPSSIVGVEQFSAEANTRYEINVRNGYAVVGSWEV